MDMEESVRLYEKSIFHSGQICIIHGSSGSRKKNCFLGVIKLRGVTSSWDMHTLWKVNTR